jgi:pSer/pThr/pTyr-binding forkhead associated (FHA) protein
VTAVLFLLRAIILVLLWGFVVAAIVAVRHDVFGTRPARAPAAPKQPRAATPKAQRPAKEAKGHKSAARKLVVTDGAIAGTTVTLTADAITIGRADDSTIVLSDDYVSTKHARLVPAEGQWLLEDLGSTNGTYLDRRRVTAPTPVPLGVPIRVGKTVMELRK